jgi:hypothetical protein
MKHLLSRVILALILALGALAACAPCDPGSGCLGPEGKDLPCRQYVGGQFVDVPHLAACVSECSSSRSWRFQRWRLRRQAMTIAGQASLDHANAEGFSTAVTARIAIPGPVVNARHVAASVMFVDSLMIPSLAKLIPAQRRSQRA